MLLDPHGTEVNDLPFLEVSEWTSHQFQLRDTFMSILGEREKGGFMKPPQT